MLVLYCKVSQCLYVNVCIRPYDFVCVLFQGVGYFHALLAFQPTPPLCLLYVLLHVCIFMFLVCTQCLYNYMEINMNDYE